MSKELSRKNRIPEEFPLKLCWPQLEIREKPETCIGIDTGVGNTCFCSMEVIRDGKFITDFKYQGNTYYFKDELSQYNLKFAKYYLIMKHYFELFAHKNVQRVVYELMPLNSVKDENVLSGLIQTQATTNYLNMLCYCLAHYFTPVPATAVKHSLTGCGNATKEQMCQAAYNITKDPIFLENDHAADAFGMAFYGFIQIMKENYEYSSQPIPEKFMLLCPWNFKNNDKTP